MIRFKKNFVGLREQHQDEVFESTSFLFKVYNPGTTTTLSLAAVGTGNQPALKPANPSEKPEQQPAQTMPPVRNISNHDTVRDCKQHLRCSYQQQPNNAVIEDSRF